MSVSQSHISVEEVLLPSTSGLMNYSFGCIVNRTGGVDFCGIWTECKTFAAKVRTVVYNFPQLMPSWWMLEFV